MVSLLNVSLTSSAYAAIAENADRLAEAANLDEHTLEHTAGLEQVGIVASRPGHRPPSL